MNSSLKTDIFLPNSSLLQASGGSSGVKCAAKSSELKIGKHCAKNQGRSKAELLTAIADFTQEESPDASCCTPLLGFESGFLFTVSFSSEPQEGGDFPSDKSAIAVNFDSSLNLLVLQKFSRSV